jgi:hypothetical protein
VGEKNIIYKFWYLFPACIWQVQFGIAVPMTPMKSDAILNYSKGE